MIALDVSNIGGISETSVELGEEVTILVGRNATNRTSLLQAIRTSLGSAQTPLRSDASEGRVELQIDDETFDRELSRENGVIRTDGSPYLDDPTVADLFAFLLEDNPARRAIERGDDLRELLLRPVDVDEIERRIRTLREERERIEATIEELDSIEEEKEQLEAGRDAVEAELDEVNEALTSVREELEDAEARVEGDAIATDSDAQVEELRDRRERLEEVQHTRETATQSLSSLENEREELAAELSRLAGGSDEDIDQIEERLQSLREHQSQIDSTLGELHNVISFNDELLDGAREVLATAGGGTETDVTDGLLAETGEVTCWTCGTDVQRERIEETLEELRSIQQRTFERKRELDNEIDELVERRRAYRTHLEEHKRIEDRLEQIDSEIAQYEDRLTGLDAEYDTLIDDIDDLEDDIKAERDEAYAAVIELQREETDLRFERNRLEGNLEEIEASLERMEERMGSRSELEGRLDELQTEIDDCRNRVERIEEETVEAFNTHMESILSLLDYHNIERIWIERKQGGNDADDATLETHIVRSTEDGAVYEDTVDHLSESEREVMGLVFALSGYLVYEVYEDVPFLMLDSLEAIDSERISQLIGYFEEYAANLVVALLPEDARALPERYTYVDEI